jgi:hypothetical protein
MGRLVSRMALLAPSLEIIERPRPVVRLPIGLIFRDTISFLNTSDQLFFLPGDGLPVAVAQLPHFSRADPENCFHLPSTWSQFMCLSF